MSDLLHHVITLIFGLVVDLFRSRAALEAELLVLKQQVIVLRRGKPNRMPFLAVDREQTSRARMSAFDPKHTQLSLKFLSTAA